MVCAPSERRPHRYLPAFWSNQFGLNIKSVGLPTIADEIVLTQGTVEERRLVAAYGQNGRIVAALSSQCSPLVASLSGTDRGESTVSS